MLLQKSNEEQTHEGLSSPQRRSEARASDVANPFALPTTLPTETEDRRVRPDELADALRAMEQKQNKVFVGLLPLQETLNQMQVEATPTEVWQEVQRLRNEKLLPRQKTKARGKERYWAAGVGGIAILATAFAVRSLLGQAAEHRAEDALRGGQTTPRAFSSVAPVTPLKPQPTTYFADGMFIRTENTRTLADLKEGTTLAMDFSQAQKLQDMMFGGSYYKPIPPAKWKDVFIGNEPRPDNFQVTRHGDRWYIQGYTNAKPGDLGDKPFQIKFFNRPQDKTQVTQVIPPPSPPPGASPREIAQKYSQSTTKTVEGGPAKTPVQVPADAMQGYGASGGGDGNYTVETTLDPKKLDDQFFKPFDLTKLPKPAKDGNGFIGSRSMHTSQ